MISAAEWRGEKELLWCLANKFISGEPSKQRMPFSKAITDGL